MPIDPDLARELASLNEEGPFFEQQGGVSMSAVMPEEVSDRVEVHISRVRSRYVGTRGNFSGFQ